ncbi:MAG: hypothetical protein A2W31_18895 [Planctomycetes bacterium RBG_16_64_10]|nr:MAG: hypothetical protein A2W31_18895 [Planctomycetes bacterium RBG_16_64_10]
MLPLAAFLLLTIRALAAPPPGRLVLDLDPNAHFQFGGAIGKRIDANRRNWLLRAPASNPGLLWMFQVRDRNPAPDIVPWAGEFVGKYLISAIQAMRMSDAPELEQTVRLVIEQLMASQAEDGYLGPFPSASRLLANWDLWGHYHCLLALLMWHEQTGHDAALPACRAAADLVCRTYLDNRRRILDAGSPEMNMAIIHALGKLYRTTGAPRYLRMMREIEADWQHAGDYVRTGLAGVAFFRTPKPRWESLHDLQGLVELYRITGAPQYRTAFLHHWQSIRHWDRRNSGAFSSDEQASGDPYQPSAIETCCTIAWMLITLDALSLTGDPRAADELECSTFNLVMAAQHPDGSWWTYNTPMDGAREASADTIVFQSRAGTPELNCCSANAPRGLGLLAEWALMQSHEGLVINYLGPMRATSRCADGTTVAVTVVTDYPLAGTVRIQLQPQRAAEFPVQVRIPAWSTRARVQGPGSDATAAVPGSYFELRRLWQPGDEILLELDMPLRYEAGDHAMFGKISIYRGPLLLAYDTRHNDFDEDDLPVLVPSDLRSARASIPQPDPDRERIGQFAPMLLVDIPTAGRRPLRLCDFGTAGCTGSRYRSWLPAKDIVPPAPVPDEPANGARIPPGAAVFSWRSPAAADIETRRHTLVVGTVPECAQVVFQVDDRSGHRTVVPTDLMQRLKPHVDYAWRVVAHNPAGATESLAPAKQFRVDPDLPPLPPAQLAEYGERPDGMLTAANLNGQPEPQYGNDHSEHLTARLAGLRFYARALTHAEIGQLHGQPCPP